MSLVLAFDCAVGGLAVAVVRDGAPLAVMREEGRDQPARLVPAIGEALAEAGAARRDISLIAVTIGPGSFTGVRVGLAAARGLALALGRPLAGVATTDVLLAQAGACEGPVVAAIDSRLGDWFCALNEGDRRPCILSAAQLSQRLKGRPSTIVGPDAERLCVGIAGARAKPMSPDPVVLARLADELGAVAWQARNLKEGLPRPLYLRGVSVTSADGTRQTVD